MNFGFRKPSLKKRIAARTSWKRAVRHRAGIKAPRGWGWITNPKKAAYNRVYGRVTIDPVKLATRSIFGGRAKPKAARGAPVRATQAGTVAGLFGFVVLCVALGLGGVAAIRAMGDYLSKLGQNFIEPMPPAVTSISTPTLTLTANAAAPEPTATFQKPRISQESPVAPTAALESAPPALVIPTTTHDRVLAAKHTLDIARAAVLAGLATNTDYASARTQADATAAELAAARNGSAPAGTDLISASQTAMDAKNALGKLVSDAERNDPACDRAEIELVVAEQAELSQQQAAVEVRREAATQQAANEVAETAAQKSGDVTTYGGGAAYSGDGSGKTDHVNGYTKSDGTYVHSYYRR